MKKRNRMDSYIIELMLAHSPPDEVASAYDREEYLEERRELAQCPPSAPLRQNWHLE